MIESSLVGQRAVGKPKAPGQLDEVEILTQRPLAEMQANEERQGNLLQEYEQRFEKIVRRPEVIQTMFRSRFEISPNWTILLCSSVTTRRRTSIFMPSQEGTLIKGWIQGNVRFGPVSDIKVCNHNGRYSIEVQVQSLFQDRTVSWIRIVNGIDKFVREALPKSPIASKSRGIFIATGKP